MASDLLTFSAPVELQAAPGEGKRPTFSIAAYTGVPMNASGDFRSPIIVDLSGVRTANKSIPILLDHDTTKIVGQGEPAVTAEGITITGTVTGDDVDSAKVITHARNGFQWQASIGGSVGRREFLEAGKSAVVNGRKVSGPLVIAREFHLKETSFVAIGADQQTSAAVAASLSEKDRNMDPKFAAWLTANEWDAATLNDKQKAKLEAAWKAETAPPVTETPTETAKQKHSELADIFARANAEKARRREITLAAEEALRDYPDSSDEIRAAAEKALDDKDADPRDFQLALIRACRPKTGGLSGRRHSSPDISETVLEAAICQAGRLESVEKHYEERTLEAAHKRFRNGIGLQEILLLAARSAGCDPVTLKAHQSISRMLKATFPSEVRAEGFSTISLPNILANVMNKFITEAFMAVESAWREITAVRNVSDFKAISSNSLTGDLQFDKLGPAGEIKHGTMSELNYTNQANTYAKMLAITRTDIINDDLGAFTQVPRRLGRGGALKINDVFWAAFLDNSTFFTTGNLNFDDGTDTALDAAGLTKALGTIWHQQTDPNGKPMGTTPRLLLVPPGQWFPAMQLMNSTVVNTGGSSSLAQVPNQNVLAGLLRVVKSTYLSNSSYTGFSALAYYVLCDPSDIPVIETCFLNGREQPVVETADADFDSLGIKVRAYHDFGVTKQEYRGGIKLKGEA